jgi:hypothetical protein
LDRSTVAALGVLALASLLQVTALAVTAWRLLATMRRVQATGTRVAGDIRDMRGHLSTAVVGFTRAVEAGRRAAAQAGPMLEAARYVAEMAVLARRVGLGRTAAIASVLAMLRQRG